MSWPAPSRRSSPSTTTSRPSGGAPTVWSLPSTLPSRPSRRRLEMTHPFEVKAEVTLDATPEEVWEAIATGPGIDTWFTGRNEVEPREGGTTRMTMGDVSEEGTVTAWDPGNRFAFRGAEGPDGSVHA